MCKVMELKECEKRIFINTKDGEIWKSGWFDDSGEKTETPYATDDEILHRDILMREHDIDYNDIEQWSVNHNKEKDTVYITNHAMLRMKERNGWNKKTAIRMIKKVFDAGKRVGETKGWVKQYMKDHIKYQAHVEYVLYGETLYIFRNRILITAYHPKKRYNSIEGDLAYAMGA